MSAVRSLLRWLRLTVAHAHSDPSTRQHAFRFRTGDSVVLNSTTFAAALNTNINTPDVGGGNQVIRIRFEIEEVNGANINQSYQLRYSRNGGAYTALSSSSSVARTSSSSQYADGDATTDVLSSSTRSFLAGSGEGADNVTTAVALNNQHTEMEFTVTLVAADLTHGDTLDFRVYTSGGVALNTYGVTPRATVVKTAVTQNLAGTLFSKAPTFFAGTVDIRFAGPSVLGTVVESQVSNAASHSFSHTLAAGSDRRMLIAVQFDGTGTTAFQVSSVTYGGVSAARVTDGTNAARQQEVSSNTTAVEVWEVLEANLPADGSNTVAITMSGTVDSILAAAICLQDTDQAANVAAVAYTSAEGGTFSEAAITTTDDNSLIVDQVGASTDWSAVTPTSPQVLVAEQSINGVSAQGVTSLEKDTAGATTMRLDWSTSQARVVHVAVAFAPAGGTSLSGVLFAKAPSFFTGTVTPGAVGLAGILFAKAPTFPQGAVGSVYALAGTLFQSTPTFFTGAAAPGAVTLTGTLFTKAPTFFSGAVGAAGGTQALTGTLFQKAPTFPAGTVTTTYDLTGSLFQKAPTFPQGAVTATYALTGTTMTVTPTFGAGAVSSGGFVLTGTLFQNTPVFPQGAVAAGAVQLAGQVFQVAAVFGGGDVTATYPLDGVLFQHSPTFPQGVVAAGGVTIAGSLFSHAPTFPQGTVTGGLSIDLTVNLGEPYGLWSAGKPAGEWSAGKPAGNWAAGKPDTEWSAGEPSSNWAAGAPKGT